MPAAYYMFNVHSFTIPIVTVGPVSSPIKLKVTDRHQRLLYRFASKGLKPIVDSQRGRTFIL